jgi:hypothetical protein
MQCTDLATVITRHDGAGVVAADTTWGLDPYHVPLSIIRWGDRWKTPVEGQNPSRHKPCDSPLESDLCCELCGRPSGGRTS